MISIKVPATSANLGPGFDTLGIALNIFNIFYVEKSEDLIIENVENEFKNENNLFIVAYNKALAIKNKKAGLYVKFDTKIPVARGLGSSSSLIVGGVLAANSLHNLALSSQEILNICNELEGHPDNIAPCLLGGLVSSLINKDAVYTRKIDVHKKFFFTIMIPDFEVKTSVAREVLPNEISIKDTIFSLSRAISLAFALQDGNEENLKVSFEDKIHEPYRQKLIPDFEILKNEVLKKGGLTFTISGSGSSCLAISTDKEFSKKLEFKNLKAKWQLIDCEVYRNIADVKEI